MKNLHHRFLVFNGCLWLVAAGEAAPKVKTLPAPAPLKNTQHEIPPKLPPTGSKLSVKPSPRPPAKVAKTGLSNPDKASAGLADQRLQADSGAPEFSLEDTLALALANNPRLDEAQAAVNAAKANIGVAGSAGKLQVGANASTEYGRNTSTSNSIAQASSASSGSGSSGGSGGSGSSGGSTPSPSRSFLRFDQLTVNASQPITTGGKVKASTRQARYQAVAQIYQLAQTEQDLILETTLGYLDVLRSGQLLRVTNANLAVSQERLRIARLRYSVGASARLDVLRAETDLADARSRRIQAVNALGSSNAALNVSLGRAPETPIRLVMISRLNLPDVAYGIKPSSVLPASQPGQTPATGKTASNSANGSNGAAGGNRKTPTTPRTGNGTTAVTPGNSNKSGQTSSGNQSTNALPNVGGNGTAGVFSGPSAPAGGSSGSSTNNSASGTPAANSGTANSSGSTATGTTSTTPGATGTAGGTAPTAGSTSNTAGTTGTSSTGSSSTTGPTANLSLGSVPANASSGLQSVAGSTRQSLAVTQAQIGAAEAAVEIAKSGKRPQLGLNLGALLRNPATFLGNFGASIGLGLAQNLFDSGRTRGQVNQAEGVLDELKAHLEGQRLEVASAIETSLLTLDSAQRRQSNSEAGVASASEALRVAQLGFRSGVRTTLDLADAQAALLSTQTDAVNARFDVADAQAALAAAVGIYTIEAQQARQRSIPPQNEAATLAKKQIEILQPSQKKKRKKFLGIF